MRHPRESAFSFDLPSDTGPVMAMISHKGSLETYTRDGTYKIFTADEMDRNRTVDNLPPAGHTLLASVGSSNEIVARSYLQIHELLNNFPLKNGTPAQILECFHDCKDSLLDAAQIASSFMKEHEKVLSSGIKSADGALVYLTIPNLRASVGEYLRHCKLAIQAVGEAFNTFYGLKVVDRIKPVKNGNFQNALAYLTSLSDPYHAPFIESLEKALPFTSSLINARNDIEHSNQQFIFENFRVVDGKFEHPSWNLESKNPSLIKLDLPEIARLILSFSEMVFVYSFLDNVNIPISFKIVPISDSEICADYPKRLQAEWLGFPTKMSKKV
jgi:hypothetical protein